LFQGNSPEILSDKKTGDSEMKKNPENRLEIGKFGVPLQRQKEGQRRCLRLIAFSTR